jgi:hypothetical protein
LEGEPSHFSNHSGAYDVIGLPQQLAKLNHATISKLNSVTLYPVKSAHNLDIFFFFTLSLSEYIFAISKFCFYHIQALKHLGHAMDQTTACTTATALVHSKLDYSK